MLVIWFICALICASSANPLFEQRIVNGTDAKPGEFPYIVSLQKSGKHSCGGSILDSTHILTAAHCVHERNPEDYKIQYGVLDNKSDKNKIDAKSFATHENYTEGNGYHNDVAVITLEEPIVFSKTVKPTVLPKQGDPTPGDTPAVLAGWGRDMSNGTPQQFLQRVDLKVYTDEECEVAHNNTANRKYHVCGGIPEGGKGQCSGDSGGPLYANGVQVGIVSWSVKPCAVKGYPGVYAKVASYVDWIKINMIDIDEDYFQ